MKHSDAWNMPRTWRIVLALALSWIVPFLVVAGCPQPVQEPIRIGINTWPGYELLHLASRLGYFEDEGVSVRILEFTSLADCRRALERGQLDGAGTTIVELVEARDNGRGDLRLVMAFDYSNGGDVILAQPKIDSIKQLKGASVAVEHGSVGVYVLGRALADAGLKLSDVTVHSMDQLSGDEAFRKGEVDAYVSYPPFSTAILASGGANRLFDTSQIPGDVLDVLVLDERTLTQRTDDVRRLFNAYDRAATFVARNPEQAYAMMAQREQVTSAEFRRSFEQDIHVYTRSDQPRLLAPGGPVQLSLQRTADYLHDAGQTERRISVDRFLPGPELLRQLELTTDR